jgi:predicted nucleic acid-binding protein
VKIATRHLAAGGRFLGTTSILGEFHAHLLYLRGREEARSVLRSLLADAAHEWAEVTSELMREASVRWLDRFADQTFSLVDAVSFEVMRRQKLTQAFAFDRRFEIAGFELLR